MNIDIFCGVVNMPDGRIVYVDNVSNNGWNSNSLSGALFLSSSLRMKRCTREELIKYNNIIDACDFLYSKNEAS